MTTSLAAFFEHLGLQWRLLDCGTRLQPIARERFAQIEDAQVPYPHPYLGQAHMAFVLWAADRVQSPNIWWFKLPLDEQGKLALAERDGLLAQLTQALGRSLAAAEAGEQVNGLLEGNSYVWEPAEAQQATLHARLTAQLKLPPSQFYAEAAQYIRQGPWDYWQALGLQGLADVVCRAGKDNLDGALNKAIAGVPTPVFLSLAQLLEHQAIDVATCEAIATRLQGACTENNAAEINGCLRALAASESGGLVKAALAQALEVTLDAEALVTLATRHGQRLSNEKLALPYLEQVAALGQTAFSRILAELLFQPGQRPHWLAAFRNPERSDRLGAAIGGLLGGVH
ncbi:DUF3549 family protein [Simiduia sp. 21SJ11W-1]|uniref:DUF3549 family protein n=1 Tax=Simiduia sp. 21SJ11W-1 TaxID=2909669 RepID=UPI0020A0151F|nr:DUF3549 family protein [Simiduia sp. 21SJ11W-1]UTA46826.1 DUF3549 family protein [Simiduia sp. 21SJ11W-1]